MKWIFILTILIAAAVFDSRPRAEALPSSKSTASSTIPVAEENNSVAQAGKFQVTFAPENPIQGEPVLITISNTGTSSVKSVLFNKSRLGFYKDAKGVHSLVGVDLRAGAGDYPISITLSDGRMIQEKLKVGTRIIAKAPFGIPESLGGNTKKSEQELISTLVQEAEIMNSVVSTTTKLWEGKFIFPLKGEIGITDVYGYSRLTGASTLSHKGTDFRATTGTPVYSINNGLVAYTGYLRNYGNVIIVDHGLGLQSVYMHLSQIDVIKGQMVDKGSQIGVSGDTGYVLGPHLHLSIRINHISIDPIKFMEIMS